MLLQLEKERFGSVDEMIEQGLKHSVLADTDDHPFIVDMGPVTIYTIYGVVRYLDARDDCAEVYEEKEITASEAIKILNGGVI